MLVIRQKMIYREDVRNNHNILYVFGDNLTRNGYGGQAKEMRGETNSFGVVTKRKAEHGSPDCYFWDGEEDALKAVVQDLEWLRRMCKQYDAVVIPLDGIGTGLAKLNETAPKLLNYIEEELLKLEDL